MLSKPPALLAKRTRLLPYLRRNIAGYNIQNLTSRNHVGQNITIEQEIVSWLQG